MQATRQPLRARRAEPVGGSAGGGVPGGAAAPAPACRICWLEEDADAGGELLSPCRCAGSQRHVHRRCLAAWMASVAERKGVHAARRCDVCRGPYCLPRDMLLREAPRDLLSRHISALLATPVGTAASYYAACGLVFSVGWALRGAWCSVLRVHTLVQLAQVQPAEALRLLLPDMAMSVVSEAILSGQWLLPLLSAGRYLQGLGLYAAARWAQATAPTALPRPLVPLALGACGVCHLAANLLQYTNMALLLLFSGCGTGFCRGALMAAAAPFRLVACAAGTLRHVAFAAAGLLPHRRRRRRRKDGEGSREPEAEQR